MTLRTLLDDLKTAVLSYLDEQSWKRVELAFQLAQRAHDGQFRKSGKPYIIHPLSVAIILASMKQDLDTLCAGLLHDVLEDTSVTPNDIESEFSLTVCELVQGVTKLSSMIFGSAEDAQKENFRRLFLAIAKDSRVVMIKLADRLHNMRTLSSLRQEKQERIAKETLDIFSPLAHRLGLGTIKWEYEDLAFKVLEPESFERIKEMVSAKRSERESYIQLFMETVIKECRSVGLQVTVFGRPKHYYSIHKKLLTFDMNFEELYDLLGIRVLTDSETDCYHVLGLIHSLFKPVSGRIKDYIAMPKLNGYQSLHTTVIGPEGRPVEVQIRTKLMNEVAEYGVAAHWSYKENRSTVREFEWINDIVDLDAAHPSDYMQQLKLDLFEDEVFVFTPKGSILALPYESTPVDFAYKIHTEVGHRCVGSKVNGVITPLSYQLQNGDRIEILTRKDSSPKLAWLHFTKTRQARSNIKSWFKRLAYDSQREKGYAVIHQALKEDHYDIKTVFTVETMLEFFDKHSINSLDDLAVQLAYGECSVHMVMKFIHSKFPIEYKEPVSPSSSDCITLDVSNAGVLVMGDSSIEVRLAKCCRPLPGDDIIGFVTIGYGISVHRVGCSNVEKVDELDQARFVDVSWESSSKARLYPVELIVETVDSDGQLNYVVSTLLDMHVNLVSVKSFVGKQDSLTIVLQIQCDSMSQFDYVKAQLMQLTDVFSVYRSRV